MSRVTYASGLRGSGDYPRHWGYPQGDNQSEERTAWVLRNVGLDRELKRRGYDPADARSRSRSAHLALTRVMALSR